jgi:hypothetical protein
MRNAGGAFDAERYEMGTNRNSAPDEAAAEQLLAGFGGGHRRLAELLSAASAPARPGELAGEEAAVAAFRSAVPAVAALPVSHRRRSARPRWARLLTVKVGGAALVLAAGGVAVAAGTGVLPGPLVGTPPGVSSDQPAGPTRLGGPGATRSGAPAGPAATAHPGPGATPDPLLHGLCQAYLAQAANKPDEVKDNPAYVALVAAAGGAEMVTEFCENLVGPHPTATAGTGQSGGRPTAPPSAPPSPAPAPEQAQQPTTSQR